MIRGAGIIFTLALIISSTGCMAPFVIAPLVGGAIACAGAGAKPRFPGVACAKQKEQALRDRKSAESMYGYKTEQEEKVIIEATEVTPNTVTSGDEIALNFNFTVLTGNDQPVPVKINQEILCQGQPVRQLFIDKGNRKSGSYNVSYSTKIPANAKEGRYTLNTTIQTPNAKDKRTCEFLIVKNGL